MSGYRTKHRPLGANQCATSRFTTNAPADPAFTIAGTGTQLIDPSNSTSLHAIATASNIAFQNGFASGATLAQLNAAVIAAGGAKGFAAPAYTASIEKELKNPSYVEWNLEIQQQLGKHDAFDIDYVGNYGYDILMADGTENSASALTGFTGVPTTAPDPRFTAVTTLTNRGNSNYNGVTTSFRHQAQYGLTAAVNYTYSHALGNVSNGGLYGANAGIAGDPLLQIVPNDPNALNYGSLDYDVRHNVSMNYDWIIPTHFTNLIAKEALGGWTVAGVMFFKTGSPYAVYNSLARTGVFSTSTPTTSYVLAGFLGGSKTVPCNNPHDTCLLRSQFAGAPNTGAVGASQTSANQATAQQPYGFGNLALNSFRGPHFFDTDVRIIKAFKVREKYDVKFGATVNNVLNHPNFATPTNSVTSGTFGTIQATVVSSPSSLYGNGQGSSPSGRVISFNAGFTF